MGDLRMGEVTDPGARFPGYRFPAIIIGEVVWLRFRFSLSLRDIPALMAARGIEVSHETVREGTVALVGWETARSG